MVFIALTPLLTFALAIAQRQERFHVSGLLGGILAVVGISIVFADQLGETVPLVPLVLVLLGATAIAESAVIVKWTPRADPFWTNAVAMLAGTALLLAVSFARGEEAVLPVSTGSWLALGYLVFVGSVAMFTLYVFGIERWTASAMSYTTLLMPIVTIALAAVIFDESISLLFAVGGAIILAGVYVGGFMRPMRRSSATSAPECLPVADCADTSDAAAPARA